MRSVLLRGMMFPLCLLIGCGLARAGPEAASSRLPRDTTFIIDTSTSMEGLPIEKARQALLLALERLQPSDWFNVIDLNSEAKALFSGSVPAQAASVRQALSYARNLRTGSGTNSLPPFQAGCNDGEAYSGLVRQVVLITDGAVVDEKVALRLLKGDLGDCRLFVVGVGALADTDFLRRVAVLGRGPFTHIAESAEVASKMVVLFEQLESPLPYRFEVSRDKVSGSTSYFGPGSAVEAAWAIDGEVITDTTVIRLPCARVFDPEKAWSHRSKAEAQVEMGKLQEAEEEYVRALVQDPTDEESWRGLVGLGRRAGFTVDRQAIGPACADGAVGPDQATVARFIRAGVIVR